MNYPNDYNNLEQCTIRVVRDGYVELSQTYEVEAGYDSFIVGGFRVDEEGRSAMPTTLYRGETIEWITDGSVSHPGWEICFSDSIVTARPSNIV